MEQRDDGSVSYDLTLRTTQTLVLDEMMEFFRSKTNATNVSLSDIH